MFDTETNTWALDLKLPDLQTERECHLSCATKYAAYVFGGQNNDMVNIKMIERLSLFERHDSAGKAIPRQWISTSLDEAPQMYSQFMTATNRHIIIVLGGGNDQNEPFCTIV